MKLVSLEYLRTNKIQNTNLNALLSVKNETMFFCYDQVQFTLHRILEENLTKNALRVSFFLDSAHKGSLYTLFLHSPLSAFCFVTNIVDIPIHMWDKCLAYIDRFLTEASRLLTRSRGIGNNDVDDNINDGIKTMIITILALIYYVQGFSTLNGYFEAIGNTNNSTNTE